MSDSQDLRLRLKAYVLQQSTPEEAQSLEAEFFDNDDLLAVLIQTEEELIERFEQGALSAEEEQAFRQVMAHSPRLRELVELQRLIRSSRGTEKRQYRLPWLFAAACLIGVLVLFGSWLFYHSETTTRQVGSARPAASSQPSRVIAELKEPGLREGTPSTGITITVTPAIKELVLQLPSEPVGSGSLTASVRAVDDPTPIWQGGVSLNDQHKAFLIMPNPLKNNDYIVTVLSNHQAVADFYFRLKISN